MVRLAELNESTRHNIEMLECPSFNDQPFTPAKPLKHRKVAIISSAGLIQAGDRPFKGGDAGYRVFTDAILDEDIRLSHISVNFDRTVATRSPQAIFPRALLKQMAADDEIGDVAGTHYSFMGATDPTAMEDEAKGLAQWLHADNVDTVVLLPV